MAYTLRWAFAPIVSLKTFRRDWNSMGGGVCIFVSATLPCRRRGDLEFPALEIVWVEFFNISKRPLLVGCCYRPPSASRGFYNLLEQTLDTVIDHDILLLGEFNAKNVDWCATDVTTADGRTLKELLDSFDLSQLCTEPTHLGNDGLPHSLLDLVITNRPDVFNLLLVHPPLGTSDHLPVSVQSSFHCNPLTILPCPSSSIWLCQRKDTDAMPFAFDESEWRDIFEKSDIEKMWRHGTKNSSKMFRSSSQRWI